MRLLCFCVSVRTYVRPSVRTYVRPRPRPRPPVRVHPRPAAPQNKVWWPPQTSKVVSTLWFSHTLNRSRMLLEAVEITTYANWNPPSFPSVLPSASDLGGRSGGGTSYPHILISNLGLGGSFITEFVEGRTRAKRRGILMKFIRILRRLARVRPSTNSVFEEKLR